MYQKRLDTLAPFSETSPKRLRLINNANSSTREPFMLHNMELGANTDVLLWSWSQELILMFCLGHGVRS